MELQVRSAYVKSDFEWDNLKKLSFEVRLSDYYPGSAVTA
jgi:hypothetical protein